MYNLIEFKQFENMGVILIVSSSPLTYHSLQVDNKGIYFNGIKFNEIKTANY